MLSTLVIAFSMSTDAFAASLGKGAALERPRFREIARTAFIFGFVEALTPFVGWTLGILASAYVAEIDHWIAFVLLGLIGVRMVWEGVRRPGEAPRVSRHSLQILVLTALGTSMDALVVGVSLSLLQADILVTALSIGAATCLMAAVGMSIGRFVGPYLGRAAEVAGGFLLIGVGTSILVRHLGIWPLA